MAGELFDTEYRLQAADGNYRWFIGRNVPLHDQSGNVIGWFGSATDIEDLKRTQHALQQSKERLDVTVGSAVQFAIIALDKHGFITSWNRGAEIIFGFQEADAIGKYTSIFFTNEDIEARVPEKEMEQAIKEGRAVDERWHMQQSGHRIFVTGAISPIWNGSELAGFVKVVQDVTERKKLDQQREDFIGIASHELKTPVTSIKVYTEALLEQFEEEGAQEKVEVMKKLNGQVERLTNLIRELLDTTKITAGELQLHFDKFDPADLILERVEELQRTSKVHNIIMNAAPMSHVVADRERIGQVITNILSNAIKYSPNGGDIFVTTKEVVDGIEVSVQDNGIGIPQDVRQKVFDKFFRVMGRVMQTYPGMGLGLYISAGIVQRHGGRIWVESEEGKGSTFSFFIPYQNSMKND